MEALATCPACSGLVHPRELKKVQAVGDRRFLIYKHKCGATNQTMMDARSYERYKARFYQYASQGREEITRAYDPEMVGRQVKGFRIDLDTISSVDDLITEWKATVAPKEKV